MLAVNNSTATIIGGLAGAVLGSITSIFTTRYIVKHGPNYEAQIRGMSEHLGKLAITQEDMREEQRRRNEAEESWRQQQDRAAEAARWKPQASIESKQVGNEQVNRLLLHCPEDFFVRSVSLLSPSGAKILEYPVEKVASKGFGVPITHASMNQIAELSPMWQMTERFNGVIGYSGTRAKDGQPYSGTLPFHGERIWLNNTAFYKLSG